MSSLYNQPNESVAATMFSNYIEGITNEDADILQHDGIRFHAPECVYVNTAENLPLRKALEMATDLIIVAHADDAEIGAPYPIIQGFKGRAVPPVVVVVSDGATPPLRELTGDVSVDQYLTLTKNEIKAVRRDEQRKAAKIGQYTALIQLTNQSVEIKDQELSTAIIQDVSKILELCPNLHTVWSHNFFDEYSSHRETAKLTLNAIRSLPLGNRPREFLGIELQGSITHFHRSGCLKIYNVSEEVELQNRLIDTHISQVNGSKDYTASVISRRLCLANLSELNQVNDPSSYVAVALDQSLLVSSFVTTIDDWKKSLWDKLGEHYLGTLP